MATSDFCFKTIPLPIMSGSVVAEKAVEPNNVRQKKTKLIYLQFCVILQGIGV